ncbi:MAG TPA: hypothetical protein VND65_21770 [Candidatus Binatia bacterium]|nr:hypothetical protein [Candidatus Binatia bacterium]
MFFPSPERAERRAPRASLTEATPAVLRCPNGSFKRSKLRVISLTGGLLDLTQPLDRGSRVRIMFLTNAGSVLGTAEMLSPITWSQQAFKFVRLHDDDEERLQTAIQSSLSQNRYRYTELERFRAW